MKLVKVILLIDSIFLVQVNLSAANKTIKPVAQQHVLTKVQRAKAFIGKHKFTIAAVATAAVVAGVAYGFVQYKAAQFKRCEQHRQLDSLKLALYYPQVVFENVSGQTCADCSIHAVTNCAQDVGGRKFTWLERSSIFREAVCLAQGKKISLPIPHCSHLIEYESSSFVENLIANVPLLRDGIGKTTVPTIQLCDELQDTATARYFGSWHHDLWQGASQNVPRHAIMLVGRGYNELDRNHWVYFR